MCEMISVKEQAWEFFIYSVLGIAKKDSEDDIIKKCIRRAYLDMNRTLLLKEPNNKDDETDNGFYCTYSEKIFTIMRKNLDNIGKVKEQAFNLFFIEKIDEKQDLMAEELDDYLKSKKINDEYKRKGKCFYFGQAQKWVNMTLKYLWLIGKIDDIELDIPIDSYIMEAASEELKIELPRDNKSVTYGEYTSTTMPWSKLSKHEYDELQNAIKTQLKKDDKIPMQWENEAWIRISEKRKGMDITQK